MWSIRKFVFGVLRQVERLEMSRTKGVISSADASNVDLYCLFLSQCSVVFVFVLFFTVRHLCLILLQYNCTENINHILLAFPFILCTLRQRYVPSNYFPSSLSWGPFLLWRFYYIYIYIYFCFKFSLFPCSQLFSLIIWLVPLSLGCCRTPSRIARKKSFPSIFFCFFYTILMRAFVISYIINDYIYIYSRDTRFLVFWLWNNRFMLTE